jgi:hypothetical protein
MRRHRHITNQFEHGDSQMTVMKIPSALLRIKAAPPSSPIAVFRIAALGYVDAMFANTVMTAQRINNRDPHLIGVFHQQGNIALIKSMIAIHA